MDSYIQDSIRIIKQGQSKSGAYIACPNFPTYRYCWLRDGSFIAHAMDCVGEYKSSEAFFRWVGKTILRYGSKVEEMRHRIENGLPLCKDDGLHTRFSLEGEEVTEDSAWGNFQIDGYGTWLWALAEHIRISKDNSLLKDLLDPINITLNYLNLVWQLPNYDCWEENPEYIHPYSLATIYSGVKSITGFLPNGFLIESLGNGNQLDTQVKEFILKYAIHNNRIVKHVYPANGVSSPKPVLDSGIDASLISMCVPYNLFSVADPIMVETVQAIEKDLHCMGGGVHRYKKDVYYGGGEWILLTAWLGWYYARCGRLNEANVLKLWIESKFEKDGSLPEQVSEHTLYSDHFQPWKNKWGPVATPLLWSHAMYIILDNSIQERSSK